MKVAYLMLLCFLFALSRSAKGQVFQLFGGTSTLYGATGANLQIFSEQSQTSIGAGWTQGHFGAGGQTVRQLGEDTLTVGQQQLRLDLPTDVFDTVHDLAGTGVGLQRRSSADVGLKAFAGLTSEEAGSPLFSVAALSAPIAAAQQTRPLLAVCHMISTAVLSTDSSFVESLGCSPSRHLLLALSGGVGVRSAYLATSLKYDRRKLKLRAAYILGSAHFTRNLDKLHPIAEPVRTNVAADFQLTRSVSLSGLHQNFQTASVPATPAQGVFQPIERSGVDEASLSYQHHQMTAGLTVLRSEASANAEVPNATNSAAADGRSQGLAISAGEQFGRIRWNETYVASQSQGAVRSALLINGVDLEISPHVAFTEALDVNGGHVTFAHGGELRTGLSTLRVDYQLLYLPEHPAQPFQQALVFNTALRLLSGLSLQASSSIDATGHTVYTFGFGTQHDHTGHASTIGTHAVMGAYAVQGTVTDRAGSPIEGAAVLIGTTRLYTDSNGMFTLREDKRRTHQVRVLLDEFLIPGRFIPVNIPATVTSAKESESASSVHVVLARSSEVNVSKQVQITEKLDLVPPVTTRSAHNE